VLQRARHPQRELEQRRQQVDEYQARLQRALQHKQTLLQARLDRLKGRVMQQSPRQRLALQRQRLLGLQRRLPVPLLHQRSQLQQRLTGLGRRLHTASPLATLDRGYSLTLAEGQPLRSVETLREGQTVETRLADGRFESKVTRRLPSSDND
ncbi:MAG: exodeoxyribonuclease VII large subunit, partial [Alcanivorax sp.]|nr:exodeoxyribonuclease VII large subunit [Alcanivorax sp.]